MTGEEEEDWRVGVGGKRCSLRPRLGFEAWSLSVLLLFGGDAGSAADVW